TAEALARDISRLQHVTVTTVPFHFGEDDGRLGSHLDEFHVTNGVGTPRKTKRAPATPETGHSAGGTHASLGTIHLDIADVRWRPRAPVGGTGGAPRVAAGSGAGHL